MDNLALVKKNQLQRIIFPPQQTNNNFTHPPLMIFDCMDISENTRNEYQYRLKPFISFIQSGGFNRNSYLEYKRQLSERTDLSVSSKNKYLIVARIYCKELNRQGFMPTDITQNVKSFQQSRKHKKGGITEDEVQKLLKLIQTLNRNYN